MTNRKITAISSLINNADIVIDVGCDHCYLSIDLLKSKKAKLVINIDINELPLKSGIDNILKNNFLNSTINLVNDGLKNITEKNRIFSTTKVFDYCVIAGMGSSSIIDILENNVLEIDKFILQTSKNEYLLREFLINNSYEIINEYYVEDNNIIYPIFMVQKQQKKIHYSKEELYFGKIDNIVNKEIYYKMLFQKQVYFKDVCKKHDLEKLNDSIKEELLFLNKRMKNEVK